MRCTLITIFITDNYIHVVETLGTSHCMASFDSKDFALLSNKLLMFNKFHVNKDAGIISSVYCILGE